LDRQQDAEAVGSSIELEVGNKDALKHTEQLQNRRDKYAAGQINKAILSKLLLGVTDGQLMAFLLSEDCMTHFPQTAQQIPVSPECKQIAINCQNFFSSIGQLRKRPGYIPL
jgi:hypothetical protein